MSWLSDAFKGVGKALGTVANAASVIPGPWQVPAQIISTIGAATSKSKNPADQTQQYIQQGADAQMAYQQAALKQYQDLANRQLAVGTADKQMAYDIARGQFASNQQNMLPYQQASLSSLQALPMLQQLLGIPAYNISQDISQYTPPEVNYATMYEASQNQMFPQDTADSAGVSAATPTSAKVLRVPSAGFLPEFTSPTSGPRGNPVMAPQVAGSLRGEGAAPTTAVSPGTTTTQALTPYTGAAYNMEGSPLFKFQKQVMEEDLAAQLAAAGLSGGTYAQRELARQNLGLAAQERERVVGNLQQMVGMGMGGSSLGQASFQTPQSANIAGMYGNMATDVASFYGNMGAIQGQLGMQTAQNMMAGMNAQAQQPSGLQTALQMASQFGWLGGNKPTQSSATSSSGSSWLNFFNPVTTPVTNTIYDTAKNWLGF